MNTLMSIRTNILYNKKKKVNDTDEDEFQRYQELIFLVDKPKYSRTNSGDIIRERDVEELRFVVSDEVYDTMLKLLTELRTVDESELA